MVLLIGGSPWRRLGIAQSTGGCTVLERYSKLTPPKMCVYEKASFIHSGGSALEVICWRPCVVFNDKLQKWPSQMPSAKNYIVNRSYKDLLNTIIFLLVLLYMCFPPLSVWVPILIVGSEWGDFLLAASQRPKEGWRTRLTVYFRVQVGFSQHCYDS